MSDLKKNSSRFDPDAKNRRKTGSSGEDRAVDHLCEKGYRILHRNWRHKTGEIDIIAEDPAGVTVFVEVKLAKGTGYGTPESWVDPRKQRKIYRLAEIYMFKNKLFQLKSRFDVITITGAASDGKLNHIQNAFIRM